MNSLHPTIKFTFECSECEIPFLDTLVRINPTTRRAYTTLYTKPTDTHSYLHYTSAHNRSCMTKGPFGQFLRLRRICTLDIDYTFESKRLINYYKIRGYPVKHLLKHANRAKSFSQKDLLDVKEVIDKPRRDIMVTRFNPSNPDLIKILKRHWNILQFSDDCRNTFIDTPMIGFRKQPNLSQILCRAVINYPPPTISKTRYQFKPCFRLGKCKMCPLIHKSTFFCTNLKKEITHLKLPPPRLITCEIPNVIYAITCKICSKQYIGETKRPLRKRMYEHRYSVSIKDKTKTTPVSRHFSKTGHSIHHMIFHLIEACDLSHNMGDPDSFRKRRELFWIWKLQTISPLGINQMI